MLTKAICGRCGQKIVETKHSQNFEQPVLARVVFCSASTGHFVWC